MKEKIKRATYLKTEHKKAILDRAKYISEDLDKEDRINAQRCKVCYYGGGVMAGQAFTDKDCESCEETQRYPTTNTDKLCKKCSTEHQCCKHCLADLEY